MNWEPEDELHSHVPPPFAQVSFALASVVSDKTPGIG
jgi:hypothetical protein